MSSLRPASGPIARTTNQQVLVAWDKLLTLAFGVALLAVGTLFLPHVTTQIGPFSTLFIAVVVVSSVIMHVRDYTTPPNPQS